MKKCILLTMSMIYFMSLSVLADSPPGLASKGGAESPHGLEKQEKMPHGWSQGKKQGWMRMHHHKHYHHHHHMGQTDNDKD